MPDYDYEEMKKEAEQYIKFEKDKKNRIAYITFDRPDAQNSTTLGMRQNYADLIHKCNVDDDVKVVVIRGEGEDFGSGGDLPEQRGMLENPGMPLLHELAINDDDVNYPPGGSYRYLSTVTDFYAKARAGNRPLQELRKISIIEAKGYCYGWHFYQAGDADLVVSSDDALFGHPAFRYVGLGAAAVVVGRDDGSAQVLRNAVHRKAVQRQGNVRMRLRQQRGAARAAREGDREVRAGLLEDPVRPTRSRCRRPSSSSTSSTRANTSAACSPAWSRACCR